MKRYYLMIDSEYVTSFTERKELVRALWEMTGQECTDTDDPVPPLLILQKRTALGRYTDLTCELKEIIRWIDFYAENYRDKAEMLEQLIQSLGE